MGETEHWIADTRFLDGVAFMALNVSDKNLPVSWPAAALSSARPMPKPGCQRKAEALSEQKLWRCCQPRA